MENTKPAQPPAHSVIVFFVLAFGIAWGAGGFFVAFPEQIEALFGPVRASHPLFILAVYAPAIAAFALVLWYGGLSGLGRYLSRLLLWRCHIGWYTLLIIGLPAVSYIAAAISGIPLSAMLAQPPLPELLPVIAFMLVLGPVEEFGWRGYALPLMQKKMAPIWAGLLLGLIWGVWHVPAFFLGGTPQSEWDVLPFLVGATAISVILTGMFNAARGSILLAVLFHWQVNMPMWPDAQPLDMYLFVVLAVAVVWFNRAAMFSRDKAATDVIPRSDPAAIP